MKSVFWTDSCTSTAQWLWTFIRSLWHQKEHLSKTAWMLQKKSHLRDGYIWDFVGKLHEVRWHLCISKLL